MRPPAWIYRLLDPDPNLFISPWLLALHDLPDVWRIANLFSFLFYEIAVIGSLSWWTFIAFVRTTSNLLLLFFYSFWYNISVNISFKLLIVIFNGLDKNHIVLFQK